MPGIRFGKIIRMPGRGTKGELLEHATEKKYLFDEKSYKKTTRKGANPKRYFRKGSLITFSLKNRKPVDMELSLIQ